MTTQLTVDRAAAGSNHATCPVFPVPPGSSSNGITLRDWMATQAMQGLLAKGFEVQADRALTQDDKDNQVAERAYRLADAMLRNR